MAKIYDKVGTNRPRRSAFDRSHEQKLTTNFGRLTPTYLEEILPGDQFRVKTEVLLRFAPMIAPVMHRIDVYMHYFFVPHRIVWDQWEDFITGGDDGLQAPAFPVCQITGDTRGGKGTLSDYLGVPITSGTAAAPPTISQIPFRAYHEIWNEFYRDENLQTKFDWSDPTDTDFYQTRQRAWEKDYFTSAFQQPQKGPPVIMPLTGDADVTYNTFSTIVTADGSIPTETISNLEGSGGAGTDTQNLEAGFPTAANQSVRIENIDGLDLTNAGVTIEDLRRSARLQEWLELAQRGGSRYIELIESMFGVRSSDARLQRPEYLGGGKMPVSVSEVLNTTGIITGETGAPQGDMAGHGISVGTTKSFQRSFEEHGYVMGIMSIMPKTGYHQGIHRHWKRFDKFDYYWYQFANLGEQAVPNEELYYDYADATGANDEVFGYQQRYAEYKNACNKVHGDFRTTLSYWHMDRIFGSRPTLSANFIECDGTERIFAVDDSGATDKLWVQMWHNVKCRRMMPYFSNPTL